MKFGHWLLHYRKIYNWKIFWLSATRCVADLFLNCAPFFLQPLVAQNFVSRLFFDKIDGVFISDETFEISSVTFQTPTQTLKMKLKLLLLWVSWKLFFYTDSSFLKPAIFVDEFIFNFLPYSFATLICYICFSLKNIISQCECKLYVLLIYYDHNISLRVKMHTKWFTISPIYA